jgi:hypothetical protein
VNWNQMDPREREKAIDRELYSENQLEIARLVRELPNEELNMAWRSELNEKLREKAALVKRKRTLSVWVFRPALGFGLAAAMVVTLMVNQRPVMTQDTSNASLASAMVKAYNEDEADFDVTPINVAVSNPSSSQNTNAAQQHESTVDPYTEDLVTGA